MAVDCINMINKMAAGGKTEIKANFYLIFQMKLRPFIGLLILNLINWFMFCQELHIYHIGTCMYATSLLKLI